MNYFSVLPLDLQRLLAKYLLPLVPEPNFSLEPDYATRLAPQKTQANPAIAASLVVYQELTGRSFLSLLEWDLGPSYLQRSFTWDELVAILNTQLESRPFHANVHLLLLLGLARKYFEYRRLPNWRSDIIKQCIMAGTWKIAEEMGLFLLKVGGLDLTEKTSLVLNSPLILRQYLSTNYYSRDQGLLHWNTLIDWLDHTRSSEAMIQLYLENIPTIHLDNFFDLWRVRPSLNLSQIWPQIQFTNWRLLSDVVGHFAQMAPTQPVTDYQYLEALFTRTLHHTSTKRWEKTFDKALEKLYQHTALIDPAIYYCFYQLYFKTRLRPANYYKYQKELHRLTNYEAVQAVLQPLFQRALASGVIVKNKFEGNNPDLN